MQYFHIPRTFIASEGIHLENLNLEYSSMLNYGISQMLEDHIDKVLVSAYDYVRYDSSFRRVLSLQRLRETILYMQKHNREAYCLRSGKDEVLTYDLLATRLLGEKHAEDLEAVFGRIAPMFETVDFTEKKWLDPSHRPPGVSYIWKDIDVEAYQEAQDSDEEYDREKWLKIGMLSVIWRYGKKEAVAVHWEAVKNRDQRFNEDQLRKECMLGGKCLICKHSKNGNVSRLRGKGAAC